MMGTYTKQQLKEAAILRLVRKLVSQKNGSGGYQFVVCVSDDDVTVTELLNGTPVKRGKTEFTSRSRL